MLNKPFGAEHCLQVCTALFLGWLCEAFMPQKSIESLRPASDEGYNVLQVQILVI